MRQENRIESQEEEQRTPNVLRGAIVVETFPHGAHGKPLVQMRADLILITEKTNTNNRIEWVALARPLMTQARRQRTSVQYAFLNLQAAPPPHSKPTWSAAATDASSQTAGQARCVGNAQVFVDFVLEQYGALLDMVLVLRVGLVTGHRRFARGAA